MNSEINHIKPLRTDRREIPWRAVAVRDESILISLRITPFRTGIYGIAWVFMGVNRSI